MVVVCTSALAGEPRHQSIEEASFKCNASKNLEGGIHGKGPFMRFGPKAASCSSQEWQRITQAEFKALATEWHGKDWRADIPFWKRTVNWPTV